MAMQTNHVLNYQSNTQDEMNNEYNGPIDMGHGGNEDLANTPRLVGGVGYSGEQDDLFADLDGGGMGRAGAEYGIGTPKVVGGEGRGGNDDSEHGSTKAPTYINEGL